MRTIPLAMLRNAAADAGDLRTAAAAILADKRTKGWPQIVVLDLARIAFGGRREAKDLAKIETALNRLEASRARHA